MSHFSKKLSASALALALLSHGGAASALGLLQAYQEALQNDPTYLSAMHENEAGQQNKVLGRSNLLPTLSASYASSSNRADVTAQNLSGTAKPSTTHPDYTSKIASLTLRQPILNLDGVARYRQGIAQSDYSAALFEARTQNLMLRLVSAYTDAQYVQYQLTLAIGQRDFYAEQMRVNARTLEKGEGTKTDMLETQAKHDMAQAQVFEADDNLLNARNALAAIVGHEVTQLDGLSERFRVEPMRADGFAAWQQIALERNAEILAQRQSVEVARLDIGKNRAGHTPRFDFIASYSNNQGETINTYNQESTVRSIGFQLSIPLYSGGSVTAATRQAVSNHEKAVSDLDAKVKQILVELRKQYGLASSSAARIDALVKSVDSATLLIGATRQSILGGVRINLDLLNAQQQLFGAERDLAQARYNYLLSYLRLRNAAGTLEVDDLRQVAGYFAQP